MASSKVYVISCPDYGHAEGAVRELICRMGGMERFVRPGERIFLKVNLLAAARPEQAITVHPAVAAAVGRLAVEAGAQVVLGDSPGGVYKEGILRGVYEKCGMAHAAREAGMELNYDVSGRQVSYPEGRLMKHMELITPAVECDGILNLCKMKTHLFMHMTGAVKNLFGLIPGLSKVGFHANLPDKGQFAHMLLDLAGCAHPRLNLMDAVLAMEGEGPGTSGTPRQVGLLLAAEDPLALDVAAAEIMGLPRANTPLLLAAEERGLSPSRIGDVEIVGAALDDLRIPDYRFPAHVSSNLIGTFLGPLTGPAAHLCKSALAQAPKVDASVCVKCGICRQSCPAQAISMSGPAGVARIDPKRCIRCYCCHELCPRQAVRLKKGLLSRLLG